MSNFISRWWGGGCLNKLIIVGLLLLLAGMSIIWIGQSHSRSLVAQTWDKVRPGDSLYVDSLATVSDTFAVGYMRLIRPVNASDVEKLQLPQWKKQKMINTLDTTNHKAGLIFSNYATSSDKMYKAGTSFIGTYIGRDSTYQPFSDKVEVKNDYHWYIVKPNKAVLEDDYIVKIPQGYVYADSNYYFNTERVKLEQAPAFRKRTKSTKKQ